MTARLRDLGHGGQTLLSGATEALVLEGCLPTRGCPIWATVQTHLTHVYTKLG